MKIRTIITQDAEVDDQNSLRHFLLYANEVELQGIVQTSSRFHWIGVPGAVKKTEEAIGDFGHEDSGPFDKPYRWPGTDWMWKVAEDYAKDYPFLCRHASGYPEPDAVKKLIKIGNIGYEGEMEAPTEGSEWIRKHILDDDERKLYLQVWGGANTIARALKDIQLSYENTAEWPSLYRKICDKVVITACGEQDSTYRAYISEVWPDIQFVKTLQMFSYAYPWLKMPEGESKDSLKASFMKSWIVNGTSALMNGYSTWMDGHYYEGEKENLQFGTNPDIVKLPENAILELPEPTPYDFLSEGDSPTFLVLLNWGFRTLENFSYGGVCGRYEREDRFNSKGQRVNLWNVLKEPYTDRNGNTTLQESMWPYVADIQRDLAARVAWTASDSSEQAEYAPALSVEGGLDRTASSGEKLTLKALTSCQDNKEVTVSFRIYPEAGSVASHRAVISQEGNLAYLTIPSDACPGEKIHVIIKAQAAGRYRLVHYQQVIITIEE